MGPILEVVKQFFTEDDWSYEPVEDDTALSLGVAGQNGQWHCYARSREQQQQFVFYSIYDDKASEDRRLAMAEFVTRANYGLALGNFEFDYNTGSIRYKTSIDVEDDRLSTALVKNVVYSNVVMMDYYLPGIRAVLNDGQSPAEALKQIEG